MKTNERGDVVISPDENLNNLIQEYIQTMEEGWLKTIPLLFNNMQDKRLMQGIIKQLEKICISVYKENEQNDFTDMIIELKGIIWHRMYIAGQKKNQISPYTKPSHYANIEKDQKQINHETLKKFQ